MSNDLILSLKNQIAELGGELDADTLAVAGGSTGSNKRISIKGGVFRKYVGGKEVAAIEERHMDLIFVKMAHSPSRTYYSKGYQEGVKISPACWSSDCKTPDAEVKAPQASSCDKCPQSIKGSGTSGSGAACRMQWRTAVVLPNDPDGDVMQLVLPATSCFGKEEAGKRPFRPYIQYLASNQISAGRVVSRMSFDTKSPVPKVLFAATAAVPAEYVSTIKEQGDSDAATSAVVLTVYQADEGTPAGDSDDGDDREPTTFVAGTEEEVAEPVVRESTKAEVSDKDVPDVISKWAKKG